MVSASYSSLEQLRATPTASFWSRELRRRSVAIQQVGAVKGIIGAQYCSAILNLERDCFRLNQLSL
jgi:hypothetical protein